MAVQERRIYIEGLTEFIADLLKAGPEMILRIPVVDAAVADDVAARAQSMALSLGSVAKISATAISAKGPYIFFNAEKKGRTPFAFGAEFGATHNLPRQTKRGIVKGWNQFKPPTREGYFLFPTLKDRTPFILQTYERELDYLVNRLSD